MNKIFRAASVIALTVAASSASAWYAVPALTAPTLTEEQRQAISDQQKAVIAQRQEMAAKFAKAAQEAMTAQQEMMRKMAEQQASYFAEMQKNAPEAPAVADPFAGSPFGPMTAVPGIPGMSDFPAMPELPAFDYPAMPERPAFPDFAAPELPAMPAMPSFGAPGYPEIPAMPEMPGLEAPAMPELPAYGRPSSADRGARHQELQSFRTKAKQEADARRAAMRDMNERRRAARAYYRPYGPRHLRYMPSWNPMMVPGMELAPPAPTAADAAQAPAQASAPVVQTAAAPAAESAAAPAPAQVAAPAAEQAPVAPAQQ
jgi:membrane-associated HD superfamily phosphohydrolase